MDKIDWSKAPEWADRVVYGGNVPLLYWANYKKLQPIVGGQAFCSSNHTKYDWELVDTRPIPDPEIDWSNAPEWADRVVRSPCQRQLFWASEIERKSFKSGHQAVNNLHVRDNWEVVARRPAHFPTRPPETFMCRCVAAPVSRTIEQRIASLRALEKRVEETRAELTRDLEALGLTWLVQGEPTITDWRDLRVGDVIECVPYGDSRDGAPGEPNNWPGGWALSVINEHHTVGSISATGVIALSDVRDSGYAFRFIRRP